MAMYKKLEIRRIEMALLHELSYINDRTCTETWTYFHFSKISSYVNMIGYSDFHGVYIMLHMMVTGK